MFRTAQEAEKVIRHKLPSRGEWRRYKRALEVVRVSAGRDKSSFAVRLNPKARQVRSWDAAKVVLYVRQKGRKVDPKVAVLVAHNPWTLSTIPFTPKPSRAVVISRRVRREEVASVGKLREGDKSEWTRELVSAGYNQTNKRMMQVSPKVKAIPDVAFEALRMEFGLGGEKTHPVWRPAIRGLVSEGIVGIIRSERLDRAISTSTYYGWERWKSKTRRKIGLREASKYRGFVDRLGIKVGGSL